MEHERDEILHEVAALFFKICNKYFLKIDRGPFKVKYSTTDLAQVYIKDSANGFGEKLREILITLPISPRQKERYIISAWNSERNSDYIFALQIRVIREAEKRKTLVGTKIYFPDSCSSPICLVSFSEREKRHKAIGVTDQRIIGLIRYLEKNLGEIFPEPEPKTKPKRPTTS